MQLQKRDELSISLQNIYIVCFKELNFHLFTFLAPRWECQSLTQLPLVLVDVLTLEALLAMYQRKMWFTCCGGWESKLGLIWTCYWKQPVLFALKLTVPQALKWDVLSANPKKSLLRVDKNM